MYLPTRLPVETETRADPRSLAHLIAWLRTQPAGREYDWYDVCGCLMHYYFFEACGIAKPAGSCIGYDAPFGTLRRYHEVGSPLPHTFGAALSRATAIRGVDNG